MPYLYHIIYTGVREGFSFLSDYLSWREEIFAGIYFREFSLKRFRGNFREFGFTENFAVINFCELSLTKNFAGINFREFAFYEDFMGVNFAFSQKNIFSMTLVYGFENILSKE